jgi:hypothetical protein
VAVLRLHMASTGHITNAAYSCMRKGYVLQSTKEALIFREPRNGEVRRINPLRTRVNVKLRGRSIEAELDARPRHAR